MKLIEKVSVILKEANRALTVGAIVDTMVKAADPFTKLPKHKEYVELGYSSNIQGSMKSDIYTAIKTAEDAKLHDIVIDRSVRPLTVFLKHNTVRHETSFIKLTFTDSDNGDITKTLLQIENISIIDLRRALSILENTIDKERK